MEKVILKNIVSLNFIPAFGDQQLQDGAALSSNTPQARREGKARSQQADEDYITGTTIRASVPPRPMRDGPFNTKEYRDVMNAYIHGLQHMKFVHSARRIMELGGEADV
jgi:hypothetical protein